MSDTFLLHIIAAWRLARIAHIVAARRFQDLLDRGVLRCADALDDSKPPDGMQVLCPTLGELSFQTGDLDLLGSADRVMLAMGVSRGLVCVSDERAIAWAAHEFGVALLSVRELLAKLVAMGYFTDADRTRLLVATRTSIGTLAAPSPRSVTPRAPVVVARPVVMAVNATASNSAESLPQVIKPSPEVATRTRRSLVRTRRSNAADADGEQLTLEMAGLSRRR